MLKINKDLLQTILNYLGSHPYHQVFEIIYAIQRETIKHKDDKNLNEFEISQELVQKIGNYLAKKPFTEVVTMVEGLKVLKSEPEGKDK